MKTMIVAGLKMNKMEKIMNKEMCFNEILKKRDISGAQDI